MSKKKKIKNRKFEVVSDNKKPNVFKRCFNSATNGIKTAAEAVAKTPGAIYGVTVVNLKPLPSAIKAKIAGIREARACAKAMEEALASTANSLQRIADRADLLDAAKQLRLQANKLEAIAKEV